MFQITNNNNDFLYANILEDQTQQRDKTKGLGRQFWNCKQCMSRRRMDEDVRKLRRIGSFKEVGFRHRRNETIFRSNLALAENEFHRVGNSESSGSSFRFHPKNVNRVTTN